MVDDCSALAIVRYKDELMGVRYHWIKRAISDFDARHIMFSIEGARFQRSSTVREGSHSFKERNERFVAQKQFNFETYYYVSYLIYIYIGTNRILAKV